MNRRPGHATAYPDDFCRQARLHMGSVPVHSSWQRFRVSNASGLRPFRYPLVRAGEDSMGSLCSVSNLLNSKDLNSAGRQTGSKPGLHAMVSSHDFGIVAKRKLVFETDNIRMSKLRGITLSRPGRTLAYVIWLEFCPVTAAQSMCSTTRIGTGAGAFSHHNTCKRHVRRSWAGAIISTRFKRDNSPARGTSPARIPNFKSTLWKSVGTCEYALSVEVSTSNSRRSLDSPDCDE